MTQDDRMTKILADHAKDKQQSQEYINELEKNITSLQDTLEKLTKVSIPKNASLQELLDISASLDII